MAQLAGHSSRFAAIYSSLNAGPISNDLFSMPTEHENNKKSAERKTGHVTRVP